MLLMPLQRINPPQRTIEGGVGPERAQGNVLPPATILCGLGFKWENENEQRKTVFPVTTSERKVPGFLFQIPVYQLDEFIGGFGLLGCLL